MKWKRLICIANKIFFYAYAISIASSNNPFMEDKPFIIQLLPLLVALAIELVCDDGKEDLD